MLTIAIDITSLLDQYSNRGIGTYTRNLILELIEKNIYTVHLIGFKDDSDNFRELGISHLPANVFFHSLGQIRLSGIKNIAFARNKYLPILKKIKPDYCICPNFERGVFTGYTWKNITVIHDIIPLIYNKFSNKSPLHNFIKKRFYTRQLKNALKSDLIITISEFSKNKITNWFKVPETKIVVNYLALDRNFDTKLDLDPRRTNVILKSLNIKKDYILYYGGLENNKNVEKLIESFKLLLDKQVDLNLVIVSKEIRNKHDNSYVIKGENGKKFAKIVQKLGLKDKIIFTGELSRDDLKILTKNAKLFVHISKAEGFGLSVLEAISLGTQAVISDIPVYRELFYKHAILVNPDSANDISKSINDLLNDKNLQNELKLQNIELGSKYTWKKHIGKLIEAINNLDKISLKSNEIADPDRIKIGFVIPHFHPYKGGAENYTLDIASLAAKNNFDVSVYTSKITKFDNNFDIFQRIKIYRSNTLFNKYYLKFYPKLLIDLIKTDAEIMHVQGFGFIWQDLCLILKKFTSKKKIRYINTPHGPFMARKNYTKLQIFVKNIFTSIQKLYLNWLYEVVIQVNPEQYKWLEKDYGIKKEKIKFLPIGIQQDHFTNKMENTKATTHSEVNNKDAANKNFEDKIIMTYLGRFHRYKGVYDLLISVQRLIIETDFKNIKLILMGKDAGDLKDLKKFIIENRLEECVEIMENPTNKERNYILDLSQIFIFPSEWEAYGIAMLEAMAHGNAIISTRTEGGLYLIENNKNGILFNHGDTNSLLKALIKLIGNDKLRKEMIKENYQKAQTLVWDKIWGEYEALYRSVLR